MCALVLGLRKVPILGPGGGGAPLGDPANPTYSVAVSDAVAAASREKAAKDSNAARLHSVKAPERENKEAQARPTIGTEALASIPEGLTADPQQEQETESDAYNIVGDQGLQSSTAKESHLSSGSDIGIQKSKRAQGRRKPGLTAPTRASEISREGTDLAEMNSNTNNPNFDTEAQTTR